MRKTIIQLLARNPAATLAAVVVGAALLSIAGLFIVGRGDAISEANNDKAILLLISIYRPLLALVLAFYFSGAEVSTTNDSNVRFMIALSVVTAWCIAPIMIFALSPIVENAIGRLNTLHDWGESASLAVLGYYFGKRKAGGRRPRARPSPTTAEHSTE
jgi:hypothetical protein